jgi:SAM-dependent methyltransferase
MMRKLVRLSPVLFVLLAAAGAQERNAPREIYRSDDLDLIVKTQSLKLPRIDELIGRLDPRPGMIILDIGAGTGQLSYKLAEALKGTGRIYAADINPRFIGYIAAQAKQRGLSNLEPLLVGPEGVDPAYSARSYDLIVMYDVYNYLKDRVDYYGKLRRLLKPGGRVVLVESESVPDRSFDREDFKDWNGLLARIRREPLDGPFGGAIRTPLRRLLEGEPRVDERALERAVLFHLNKTLDLKFYLQFTDGLAFKKDVDFTPQERPYAEWLLHRIALDGVSDRDLGRTELQLFRLMQSLNKLLLIQHYRAFLDFDDVHPYWSRAMEVGWYREHERRVGELASAGYALERRFPLPPFQAIWIFRAAD